jgi:nucleoside-diphosphate-sugar epimerase
MQVLIIGAEASRKFVRAGHRPIIDARHRDDRLIGDILDKVEIETVPGADIKIGPRLCFLGMPYPPHGVYDISRARNEPGFAREYDVERGVGDYLDTLRAMRERGR